MVVDTGELFRRGLVLTTQGGRRADYEPISVALNLTGNGQQVDKLEDIVCYKGNCVFYVDEAYNIGCSNGSRLKPFIRIQDALDAIGCPTLEEINRNVYVICVAKGTYTEDLIIPPSIKVQLIALGLCILGDGTLPFGGSVVPRSITIMRDAEKEEDGANPPACSLLGMTGNCLSFSDSASFSSAPGWIISGDILFNTCSEAPPLLEYDLTINSSRIQGKVTTSGVPDVGVVKIHTMFAKFEDEIHIKSSGTDLSTPTGDGRLLFCLQTRFCNTIKTNIIGRFEGCRLNGFCFFDDLVGPTDQFVPSPVFSVCSFDGDTDLGGGSTDYKSDLASTLTIDFITQQQVNNGIGGFTDGGGITWVQPGGA